jgi:hypothetical protein
MVFEQLLTLARRPCLLVRVAGLVRHLWLAPRQRLPLRPDVHR